MSLTINVVSREERTTFGRFVKRHETIHRLRVEFIEPLTQFPIVIKKKFTVAHMDGQSFKTCREVDEFRNALILKIRDKNPRINEQVLDGLTGDVVLAVLDELDLTEVNYRCWIWNWGRPVPPTVRRQRAGVRVEDVSTGDL